MRQAPFSPESPQTPVHGRERSRLPETTETMSSNWSIEAIKAR